MVWLDLSVVLVAAVASSFGSSFLSSAWKRRKKIDPETLRVEAMLPGYDCGLCGSQDCRSYAEAIDTGKADPALCSPGGARLEERLRASLSERPGDGRGLPLRAVVRCGGREGDTAADFPYDGRPDCRSASGLYGGPKSCKEGCLGFGTCVEACPLGAISVSAGIAVVNPALCSGCGECARACPTGVISLLPREQAWYVACASSRDPESRSTDCRAACDACGECARLSGRSEFRVDGSLARESADAEGGRWAEIADRCPRGSIVLAGTEKKRRSPFRPNGR
jgi:Na+-translocating ferredoxin:NAD+ oxidoreductase subunit B